ncbi:uncharacterized protein J3D65DRAFT_614129 [Phyllosticta citribraziliensis]|uniref:Uncharacterized protein n=1 Tax=Phyllosticta citribraziliensis TaxID=989973 RepID=A0ABR1M4L9_9PEZI
MAKKWCDSLGVARLIRLLVISLLSLLSLACFIRLDKLFNMREGRRPALDGRPGRPGHARDITTPASNKLHLVSALHVLIFSLRVAACCGH